MANSPFAVKLQSGQGFAANPNTALWQAAFDAGVVLPHSCRTGRCSSCKTKVLQGQTTALQPELGLTQAEQAQGWILSCVRAAQSDVLLDVGPLLDVNWPKPQTLPCKVQSLERVAADVLRVQLRLPPTARFEFLPGQYIEVIGPGGVRRAYSLANAQGAEFLELHIRRVEGGQMSAYWFEQAKVGDLLRFYGPLGTFVWQQPAQRPVVLLATGTGIAPVLALLHALHTMPAEQRPSAVHVLWGGRVPEDFYGDVAGAVAEFAPLASVQCVLSRPHAGWVGPVGYVQDIAAQMPLDWAQVQVYACGSGAMINSARVRLVALGLAEGQFFSDAFVCSAGG